MTEFYKDVDPEQERLRLQNAYPNLISVGVLSREILTHGRTGQTLLDVGCGPNPGLAICARGLGVTYAGLDLDPTDTHLRQLRELGVKDVVRGDAISLPFADSSVDFTHMRALLMFYPPKTRAQILAEASQELPVEHWFVLIMTTETQKNGPD